MHEPHDPTPQPGLPLGDTPPEFCPAHDLPGAVFMIPNSHWAIPSATSADHPGACAHYMEARRDGVLVSGTDAENPRGRHHFVVAPDDGNGLGKPTAFNLVPRYFRLHRLKLYFPERHIGRLTSESLAYLQNELVRLHPEEG